MRKVLLFVAALLVMTVPVMAVSNVTITCTKAVDSNWVTVHYHSDANLIRAFGLDLTTDVNGITQVWWDVNGPYRIFPGHISFVNGDVNSYGTPYDPCALGSSHVVIEMGSLYTMDASYASDGNAGYNRKPTTDGNLLKFLIDINDCNYKVDANILRGGIVMEDPYETPTTNLPCSGSVCGPPPPCIVPDVTGMTPDNADATISNAGLAYDGNSQECNSVIGNGLVLRTSPPKLTPVTCGSSVSKVLSINPPLPTAATAVAPLANTKCVSLTQILSWTPGANTATQDVYFGTATPALVLSGTPVGTTTYNPGAMTVYKRYYWRIDEYNACGGKTVGTVWCFVTGPQAGKPCCSTCLGNVNTDTTINATDVSLLVNFVSGLTNHRCTTAVGSATCPPCDDINGDGTVNATDVSLLVNTVSGFTNHRHTCPYPDCGNP